jgi:hypothetical protein
MMKTIWSGAMVGIVALAACGTNGPPEQSTPVCVGPASQACWLIVQEQGFVHAAVPVTDGVSTGMVRHTPGRFCMSGKLDPGPTNMNWGAFMVLGLAQGDLTTGITAPFTAGARGIAKMQFTIDPVPVAGLNVALLAVQRADCGAIPDCLTTAPFFLMEAGTTPTLIENSGSVTASLDAFHQPSWGDPTLSLDKDLIVGVQFEPLLLPGVAFNYDFCAQGLTFLDGAGREVAP